MIYAALLAVVGLVIAIIAALPAVLAVDIFLVGLAIAIFALARHAFMTTYVPIAYRARALSSLGGTFRFGYFIGPFITVGVIHLTGSTAVGILDPHRRGHPFCSGSAASARSIVEFRDDQVTQKSSG